jgi:hypothetical protein
MTKLMFCGDCGDVVSPGLRDMNPRYCECGRHAVWWRDGSKGLISVHDIKFPERNGGDGGKAWVIGLHNHILQMGGLMANTSLRAYTPNEDPDMPYTGNHRTRKAWVEQALADTPDSYLFKQVNSMVVRFAPGATSDSKWEAVVPRPLNNPPIQ